MKDKGYDALIILDMPIHITNDAGGFHLWTPV